MSLGDVSSFLSRNNNDISVQDRSGNAQRAFLTRDIGVLKPYNSLLANLQKIKGVIPITILADLSDVTTTEKTVWPAANLAVGAQDLYKRQDTAGTITLESTSDEDTNLTGIGIWTVKVSGLNNDYEFVQEVVELNGTTPVTLNTEMLAINEMNPELVGTALTSQGDIIARIDGTDILATIQDGSTIPVNITRQSVFTVPKGARFYMTNVKVSSGKDDDITTYVYAVNPVNGILVRQQSLDAYQKTVSHLENEWILFPEKHLLESRAISTVAGTKAINVLISGILIIDDLISEGDYSLI